MTTPSPTVVGTATVVIRAAVDQVRKDIKNSVTEGWKDAQQQALAAGRQAGQRYGRGFKAGITQSRISDHINDQFKQTERDAGIAGAKAGRRYAAAFNAAANGVNPPTPQPLPRPTGNGGGSNDGGGGNGGGGGGGSPGDRRRQDRPTPRPRDTTSTHTIRTVLRNTATAALAAALKGIMVSLKGLTILALAAQGALAMQAAIAPLIALIGYLSQMAGVLLMLPSLVNAVALPLAALAVGFSGIGGAFAAMKDSGQDASKVAKAVADAQKGVESAQRGVASAERGVEAAVRNTARARENLNDVIKQTIERVQDLNLELKGSALDEEDAVLGIERARERLANMPKDSTALDYKEANLAIRQAQQRLDEVRESNEDLRDETKQANDEGIEGSRDVRDAKQALLDAQQGEIDAQQELTDATERLAEAFEKVNEAAKGDGVDKFAEAMAKLAPSAQEFVLAMQALGPQWTEIRKFAQEKLFAGLGSDVTNLANVYFPRLKEGLGGLTGAFNGMAKDIIKAFAAPDAVDKFYLVMERTRDLVERMRPGIFALVGVWKNLSTVGSEFFPQLGDGFTSGAQSLERWSQNFDHIREIIRNGIDVAKQFGEVIGNLGSGIGRVFEIGNETGGGFLNGLIQITDEFDKFVHSTEGTQALKDFFEAGQTAITAIAPVIKEIAILIGSTVGPMLADFGAAISPAVVSLLQSLGAGFENLQPGLDALVPVFDGLSAVMATVLPLLGTLISGIVTSLGPVLVTVMEALGNVIVILAPAIQPLADALGAVLLAVTPLLEPIASLVALVVERLAPIIQKLAEFITPLIQAFADMLTYVIQNEDIFWTLVTVFGALAAVLLSTKIALAGYLAFVRVMMAVSKAWTIVTGILNAVMSANPIALIVIAIVALIAAIVLAYQHSETFRNIVQTVWEAVKTAASVAWNIIKEVFGQFIEGFRQIGDFFTWVWENLIKPAWEALSTAIKWYWENVIKVAWDALTAALKAVGDFFSWVWNDVIKPAWEALGDGIKWVIDNVIQPAFDLFQKGIENLGSFVDRVVSGIKTIWESLQDAIKAPVRFIVETVYGKGIRPAWNAVSKLIPGMDELPELNLPQGFAKGGIPNRKRGGVESGYSPGRDDRVIAVGGGEAVMRPEWTRAVGPGYVNTANAVARNGGVNAVRKWNGAMFAEGGIVESMTNAVKSRYPMIDMTSGLRFTDNGYHSKGMAADFSNGGTGGTPEMQSLAAWIADNFVGPTIQLIHKPFNRNIGGGADVGDGDGYYTPGTMEEHRDHVHWAVSQAVNADGAGPPPEGGWSLAGAWNSVTSAFSGAATAVFDKLIAPVAGWISEKLNENGGDSPLGQLPGKMFDAVKGKVRDFIVGKDGESTPSSGGPPAGALDGSAEQYRPMVERLFNEKGIPLTSIDKYLYQLQRESNFNPNAINDWDINAINGTPSKGIAQVIDPTFQSYKDPGYGNIWDAESNIRASLNYLLRDPKFNGQGVEALTGAGYDNGGWLKPGLTLANNQSGVPEPVFTGQQWDVLKQGLNHNAGNEYLKNNLPSFQTSMQDLAVDAFKETVVGGLFGDDSIGIDGLINKLIDQAISDNPNWAQPPVSPGEAATGNPNAIADTINFYGMDPQRVTDEISRVMSQGMAPTGGRYREP